MMSFEHDYSYIIREVLTLGQVRKTRNQVTRSLFGKVLKIKQLDEGFFPLLTSRKMHYKGVFGELAAMLRCPKNIKDFEAWGCNYWKKWANEDGSINIDYGNEWMPQIQHIKDCLANPDKWSDRRMLINGWNHEHLDELSLPCCHYAYQFYVQDSGSKPTLHMLWHQRSVDLMVGLPSDIVFAAAWLITLANEFNMRPGEITMTLGDTHIYEGHVEGAKEYLQRVENNFIEPAKYSLDVNPCTNFMDFTPDWIAIKEYEHLGQLKFELYE